MVTFPLPKRFFLLPGMGSMSLRDESAIVNNFLFCQVLGRQGLFLSQFRLRGILYPLEQGVHSLAETRNLVPGQRRGPRGDFLQWVSVNPIFRQAKVQMGPGGESGGAYVSDNLLLADMFSFVNARKDPV